MKSKLTFGIIGCTLLMLLTPSIIHAQNNGNIRRPQTCPSRKAPTSGAPSVEQAKKYFTCHAELEHKGNFVLIDDLTMQISPRARRYNSSTDGEYNLNHRLNRPLGLSPERPVYDIQGSYTNYECRSIKTTCRVERFTDSRGVCFQNNFGDWHCTMVGSPERIGEKAPPSANRGTTTPSTSL